MTNVKTRIEAKKASIEKWRKINEDIDKLGKKVENFCGFCLLGKKNVPKSVGNGFIHKCNYCEPDARRLCEEYITANDQRIPMKIAELKQEAFDILNKIKALPDVLNEV